MQRLIETLNQKITLMKRQNKGIDLSDERLDDLYCVFPFNKFEYIIAHLISTKTLNLNEYLDIRNAYLERNKYYSQGQHRGNVGEGQLWLKESNINEFKCYEVSVHEVLGKIRKKGGKL